MFSSIGHITTFSNFNFFIWFLLAFQAGVLNVGGFLACNRYVTHLTGSASRFGVEMALGHPNIAIGALAVPLAFILGTMTSAFFVDRKLNRDERPQFPMVFFLMSCLLLGVVCLGALGYLGVFGAHLNYHDEYALIALLAFCAGLQNAAITTASGTVVRTTHLTGLSTDLGIGLVRLLSHNEKSNTQKSYEIRAFALRLGLILFFTLGGVLGGWLFTRFQYLGFSLPLMISLALFAMAQWREVKNARFAK